ncbi:hypothetical protein PP935_gp145 [Rhizobium phage RHph_N34]|uniref:MotA/TolQ/ExbB proton channel domain-containing protein n=1 Tax=Rhizobium phage RHph_N34 TaxID=2509586 RepID=A0A7S5UX30_9CAUD|nr:hypothetical protein PP935_gp145 [Rhizobium phage RHph_N34]QIG73920.1 hypothetical protein EVC06_145 [Rhizobium phage RHph_N34]
MFSKLQRWFVFTSIMAFLLAYVNETYGFGLYVLKADTTYVARTIMAIYWIASFSILWTLWHGRSINKTMINFVSRFSMGLGLLGTVTGMSSSYRVLESFDPNQVTDLIRTIGDVAGSAPIATAFGIACWLLLELQRVFVELDFGDETE